MIRKILISAAVILLLCSVSPADIGQVEGFSIGSFNIVARCGSVGSAEGANIVMFNHSQQIQKPFFFKTTAKQQEKGTLVQLGTAKGAGGVSGLAQHANVQGTQNQFTGRFGSTVQSQQLNIDLGQVTVKSGGVGSTQAVQAFVGDQSQMISTPGMTSSESQSVGVVQFAAVSGRKDSRGIVVNSVNVDLSQGQFVNTGPGMPR